MKSILSIVGARPQFVKHAPMQIELQKYYDAKTLHTGQHYDENMSKVFFDELKMQKPDFQIDIGGSKTQGEQTAIMLTEIEKQCLKTSFDMMLVYGDTNSTLAGALAASKLHIPLIHIEAGLRSFNKKMPEEINRIITDDVSDMLFAPTKEAVRNLENEGIKENVHLAGDVMVDTLMMVKDKVQRLYPEPYYFATLHRPYNTDEKNRLSQILESLNALQNKVILATHPRTKNKMQSFRLSPESYSNIVFIDPIGYMESISYQNFSEAIITDSGGIQKEAYVLQKKCITLRSETEWVETLKNGWNTLVFDDLSQIKPALAETPGPYTENLYGDGHAAEQIVGVIKQQYPNYPHPTP